MAIASKEGYSSDTVMVSTLDIKKPTVIEKVFGLEKLAPPPPKPVEPEFEEIAVEIDQPIRLSNIYYEFNDDKILRDAEGDLNVLLDLMNRYPEMVIELSSHTDSRGGNDFNQDLSQRRANSATNWLIERGIAKERIKPVGYGENRPATIDSTLTNEYPFLKEGWVLDFDLISKISGKDNREAAHQINRRTEFRIIEGPTVIKIKRMEKRVKKVTPEPKVIPNKSKKKRTRTRGSKNRNANPPKQVTPKKKGPKMVFKHSMVDFGLVKKGEKREHTFEFTNEGNEALTIELVTACDCTTLDYSTSPVPPGDSGKIHAIFDSSEKEEAEQIDIDIILENTDPKTGYQIIERVSYTFDIEK